MLKWLVRIGLGIVSLVALLIAGGAIYEFTSRLRVAHDFPAPGRLVDIGGRKIQIDCRGTGTPVVVFQSGLDPLGSLSWSAVHDKIAKTTRACAYSRAGMMWSDADPAPFSSAHAADDLHKALAAAGERPPFVMVAHSLGGPYLLVYTRRYPKEVAGLVFVDASHPDQIAQMRAAIGKDLNQGEGAIRLGDAISWSGVVRLTATANRLPAHMPETAGEEALAYQPQSLHATVKEIDEVAATLDAARGAEHLGDRPLVVLTHGAKMAPQLQAMAGVTPAQSARLDMTWFALHNDEATWSARSQHIVVPGATHYIQFDAPDTVVAAVADVVQQVRSTQPSP